MKCHLCGGWKTPVYLGELMWHCSPCGVKQYEEQATEIKEASDVTPNQMELFS